MLLPRTKRDLGASVVIASLLWGSAVCQGICHVAAGWRWRKDARAGLSCAASDLVWNVRCVDFLCFECCCCKVNG